MKNPENTTWSKSYFKGMTLKKFIEYWERHGFIGNPKDYYHEVCQIKKRKKNERNDN